MAAKKRKNASSSEKPKVSGADTRGKATNKRKASNIPAKRNGGIHRLTIYGVVVLVFAILAGLIMNHKAGNDSENDSITVDTTVDASFGNFWKKICGGSHNSRSRTHAWCGGGKVEATRRTLQAASEKIRRGDVVAEIPRELQIWEIDALQSQLVQTERLVRARHKVTENPLASGAFLATHLAFERKRLLENDEQDSAAAAADDKPMDKVHAAYFQSLPSWEELSEHHPVLKSRSDLQSMLGHHSWNYAVVAMYQEMITSEYEALATVSPLVFEKQISLKDYQTARIYVLSRSFNPGSEACSTEADKWFSPAELQKLHSDWGVQASKGLFGQGCHAMVPILDTLNSHPQPNVVYNYDVEKQAFIISAKSTISSQWELMNSYGKFSDAHLYSKFGFVNGDGSGYTQASIALFHRPLDVEISQEYSMIPEKNKYNNDSGSSPMDTIPDFQKANLKRYLTYDDGYDSCVQKDLHPEAFRLKRLKWLHLAKIANEPKFWVATLRPRSPKSRPKERSDLLIREDPPEVNPQKLGMDMTHLVGTCRLLALTVDDFEGKAVELLEENMRNDSFVVPKGSEALEYRSLMFLARLSGMALMQYPVNLKKEYANLLRLNRENAFGDSTWTAAQLRLGEMQSLHALSGISMSYARGMLKDSKEKPTTPAYNIREKSCPQEYTDILVE